MSSFQQLPKSIKNDPLHSSRCPVAGGVGVDGKMIYISKTEEGTESFQPGRMALLANVVIDACGGLLYSFVRIYLRRICSEM